MANFYRHFTFIIMTINNKRNNEDAYKIDYQDDYNDGDKIRERMDQQFSEARMRTQNIYTVLKCAVVVILCLLLVIICLLILTVILVNNMGSGDDDGLYQNETSTRPNNQETCDEGWFDKTEFELGCLLFHYEKVNYVDAKQFCSDRGANLIELEAEEQLTSLRNLLKQIKSKVWWWGGATDEKAEGEWVWTISGNQLQNWMWLPDQPPNGGNTKNYFTFYKNHDYFGATSSGDSVCSVICQKV